ncbi:MAG TPA: hypothetical protein VE548_12615 [Nitrososphaeraceae archaeon]|jgi:hypothetical protein|nr:hypothetical protein [Nitrososphaeraceae archaeon]
MNNLIENEELIDELANQLNDTTEANHKVFVCRYRGERTMIGLYWYAECLLGKMR